ncbi:MAG: alpha/beta hydrolase [Actinomycetota bacterium]
MPKVFVHGNPECAAVWGPLADALEGRGVDDVVRLSPPGFGAPVPDGFDATMVGYRSWLASELDAIEGPIDLVGHDWGAGHVVGVAADHPELIRSFAVDVGGLFHHDYEWHDMARAWQTPDVGEQVVAAMVAAPVEERVAMYEGLGMPHPIAEAHAEAADETMGACILSLYRSAVPPAMGDLGDRLRAAERRPSMILIAEEDHFVPAELALDNAEALGSRVVTLAGQGHWWMLGAPGEAADALVAFWAELD